MRTARSQEKRPALRRSDCSDAPSRRAGGPLLIAPIARFDGIVNARPANGPQRRKRRGGHGPGLADRRLSAPDRTVPSGPPLHRIGFPAPDAQNERTAPRAPRGCTGGAGACSPLLSLDLGPESIRTRGGVSLRDGLLTRVAVANEFDDRPGSHQAARAPFWRLIAAVLDEHDSTFVTLAIRHKGPPPAVLRKPSGQAVFRREARFFDAVEPVGKARKSSQTVQAVLSV